MKLLEHLLGTGIVTLETGDTVRANYDIHITQDEPDTEGASDVSEPVAFKHVGGRIWSEHDPYFVLDHARKTLMLQMEDGRKFRFFHRDLEGSIGLKEWIG
jgi:hypothetical protein